MNQQLDKGVDVKAIQRERANRLASKASAVGLYLEQERYKLGDDTFYLFDGDRRLICPIDPPNILACDGCHGKKALDRIQRAIRRRIRRKGGSMNQPEPVGKSQYQLSPSSTA